MHRIASRALLCGVASWLILTGCSSNDDDDDGQSCVEAAGTWNLLGGCLTWNCTIAQSQCNITTTCTWGTLQGAIDGNAFTVTDGETTCNGNINGNAMSGSCTGPTGDCSFSGNRAGN